MSLHEHSSYFLSETYETNSARNRMFVGIQPPGMLADLGIDTSTYLSPMDLYDQIFWGKDWHCSRVFSCLIQ